MKVHHDPLQVAAQNQASVVGSDKDATRGAEVPGTGGWSLEAEALESTGKRYYVVQGGEHLVDSKLKNGTVPEAATVTVEIEDRHVINVGVVPTKEPTEVPKFVEVETLTKAQLDERTRDQHTTRQLLSADSARQDFLGPLIPPPRKPAAARLCHRRP